MNFVDSELFFAVFCVLTHTISCALCFLLVIRYYCHIGSVLKLSKVLLIVQLLLKFDCI